MSTNTEVISMSSLEVKNEELSKVKVILDGLGFSYVAVENKQKGTTTLAMELTDEQYQQLSNALTRLKVKTAVVSFANSATNAVINTTEYVAKDIAVPVAKLGFKAGAGAVRIGAECAVIAGASAVNVLHEQGAATIDTIKKSEEFQEAKQSLKKLGSFLGLGGSSYSLKRV